MPSYDYRCSECDTVFEVTRKATDTSEVRCPRCDAETKRVFTPVGVVFKGSGFHNTDYRKKTPAAAESSSPCASADSGNSACNSCPAKKAAGE